MSTTSPKVLLVEDEMLIAMHMEDMLIEMGFEVVGPAMRLQRAVDLANREQLDLALLDINLANETSFPVARLLRRRHVPFAFVSGYGTAGLANEFRSAPILQKPVEKYRLEKLIGTILDLAR